MIQIIRKLSCCFLILFGGTLLAQDKLENYQATIKERDSLFWQAYNQCDTSAFSKYFSTDIEFYHDKGGLSKGLDTLVSSFQANICSRDYKLRRELVPGSLKIFPLKNQKELYGIILSGEHLFYIQEKGKQERLDGAAKFTNLWMLQQGTWKMSRVLSFDHGPVPYANKRKAVDLSSQQLKKISKTYSGTMTKNLSFQIDKKDIFVVVNNQKFQVFAESET